MEFRYVPDSLGEPMRIVIVDDDPNTGAIFEDSLSLEGHEVQRFTVAIDALSYILSAPPDVIILDLRLPSLDGVSFLERLWLLQQDIPVIVVSGHVTPETLSRCLELGAIKVFSKPVVLDTLSKTIATIPVRHQNQPTIF
jgi:DNA-binding response OmpR family regulator